MTELSAQPLPVLLPKKSLLGLATYETASYPSKVKTILTKPLYLASNENSFGASPKALAAIRDSLDSFDLARYPSSAGLNLIQSLAEFYSIPPSSIILGNGSLEVMQMVIRAFADPGDEVVISEYAYAPIALFCQSEGLRVNTIQSLNYGHDLQRLANAVSQETRIIILVNPNNPTGTWFSELELAKLLERVSSNTLVVLDEAYFEYSRKYFQIESLKLMKRFPNLFLLRTFSKAHGLASFRVGYGIAHPILMEEVYKIKLPFSVNKLALIAAEAALNDHEHVQKAVDLTYENMQSLRAKLDKLGISYIPSAGNFLCVQLNELARDGFEYLSKQGIHVRKLANYQLSDFLRITVGDHDEIQILMDHLIRFKASTGEYYGRI